MTSAIARNLALNWRLLPVLAMLLFWFFFSGFRAILRARVDRVAREVLLLFSCFGFLFAILFFASYGLVDPANGFARPGAVPVSPVSMARFAELGYLSLITALLAGALLEWRMRRKA
jgi:hypothetical protein